MKDDNGACCKKDRIFFQPRYDLNPQQLAQRATIAHLSPMCQVNLPQNLMQPFPHPNDATHKI